MKGTKRTQRTADILTTLVVSLTTCSKIGGVCFVQTVALSKKSCLAILMPLVFAFPVLAQVTLKAPMVSVDQGQSFGMDITTTQFEEIVSLQMSMSWDPAVIKLDSIRNFGLPFLDPSDFNTLVPGFMAMVWFDFSLGGVSVDDDSPLFTLHFTAVGAPGSNTDVLFDQSPISIEIGKLDSLVTVPVDYELSSGEVQILLGTGSINREVQHAVDFPYPNPFSSRLFLPVALAHTTPVNYQLIDCQGKICASETSLLPGGLHNIHIMVPPLAKPGAFTLVTYIDGWKQSRKIIFAPDRH